MDTTGYSLADIKAATEGGDGLFGGASWVIILILFLMFGGGFGNRGGVSDPTTLTAVQTGFANQANTDVLLSSANNNYETARLISDQSMLFLNQNNTNNINMIQGFNQIQQAIATQGAQLQASLADISYHMDTCCCSIKTQMLQDRLADAQAKIVAQQSEISNAAQTQTLLNALGKYTPGE